jgi:hypothetical protein
MGFLDSLFGSPKPAPKRRRQIVPRGPQGSVYVLQETVAHWGKGPGAPNTFQVVTRGVTFNHATAQRWVDETVAYMLRVDVFQPWP